MTNEEIAKQWMESKFWGGWRVGMVTGDWHVISARDDEVEIYRPSSGLLWLHEVDREDLQKLFKRPPFAPDLSHPGTRAFLLEDVRRRWNHDEAYLSFAEGDWTYWVPDVGCIGEHDTETEALLAALQAAPESK